MVDSLTDQVLNASATTLPGLYLLGPLSHRINFYAHQRRALNLICAIHAHGLIDKGDRVAVIGAGLSGLTAAMALVGLDCDVSVYESASEPMFVERYSHRYIHPTLSQWPWLEPSITTQLPFLDWFADSLSNVAEDVWQQAHPFLDGRVITNVEVTGIRALPDGKLDIIAQNRIIENGFRVVIVADDLGRDRQMLGLTPSFYWRPDKLEFEHDAALFRTFLISGCGDGGLIDALRLVHRNYRGGQFAQEIAEQLYRTDLAETIRSGEELAFSKGEPNLLRFLYTDAAARIAADYTELNNKLHASTRHVSDIILVDKSRDAPFSLCTAPIHKLLIADALHRGAVSFITGSVALIESSVVVGDRRIGDIADTQVLVRHGAELSVTGLFSEIELANHNKRLPTRRLDHFPLLWPDKIAVPPQLPAPNVSNRAFIVSRLPLVRRAVGRQFHADVFLEKDAFGITTSEYSPLKLPEQLFGIPVRVRSQQMFEALGPKPAEAAVARVFLSYARVDHVKAREIALRFRAAGLQVVEDAWQVGATAPSIARDGLSLATNDVVLVLVSPASLTSAWVQIELGAISTFREFRDRKIRVVPVLLEGQDLPAALRHYQWFDLTENFEERVDSLVDQLRIAPLIDFSRLDQISFERLVADLLSDLGFDLSVAEREGDFDATFEDTDPFGAARVSRWVVTVKYRRGSLSIAEIRAIAAEFSRAPNVSSGVLITSARLTSVARDFVARVNAGSGTMLRVLDGTDLSDLLQQRPSLIRRHLSPGEEP